MGRAVSRTIVVSRPRSPDRAALEYWVFPLPELGGTRLTLEWKSRRIGPVGGVLRASVLRAASGRVRAVSVGSAGGAK
jgi:hypothetical protein